MAWDQTPMKSIRLVRRGEFPEAERPTFIYTYKSLRDGDAAVRAWRALARDMPKENPLDWKVA